MLIFAYCIYTLCVKKRQTQTSLHSLHVNLVLRCFSAIYFVPKVKRSCSGRSIWSFISSCSKRFTIEVVPPTSSNHDILLVDSDELFTKHTVSEARAVQQRLRADADAKQEELRLMVGERYRDLLQASTSIIAIAKSSHRVLDAIEQSRGTIVSQSGLPPPDTVLLDGVDDRHLYTLQVLAAHMKLLLDAPEHLWRLIERKKYLQAAWLFLLARVVHRALVRHDETEDQPWVSEGVDVSTEFPLVQRQWDVVSQFRSQIIHKSTLALREASASTEDTCATLVTLHLLDSRPLNDTLAALLSQRSKTLQSVLSWIPDSQLGDKDRATKPSKGHAANAGSIPVREVTQAMKKAFSAIARTTCTAKAIFQQEGTSPPLIVRVLDSIQADSSQLGFDPKDLPDELRLSTQSLLTQLTSSANFQLLPSHLRSYRPYVDLTSSSTSLIETHFAQRLQEWFRKSTDGWQTAARKWFSGLLVVKDVWSLRTSVRKRIMTSGLDSKEKDYVLASIDDVCHERINGIWKKALSDAENEFKVCIHDSTSSESFTKDPSPPEFLFSPPPIPVLSQSSKAFADTQFQKYQLAFKRQLVGRSLQLDAVLSTLEQCARTIQQDILHVKLHGDGKRMPLVDQLKINYQPAAHNLSSNIVAIIRQTTTDFIQGHVSDAEQLAFLSRLTEALSSSAFVEDIGCSPEAVKDFRREVASLNNTALQKWREVITSRIVNENKPSIQKYSSLVIGSSPDLLQSLLSIADEIRHVGVVFDSNRQSVIVQETLRSFVKLWAKESSKVANEQNIFDLAFLRNISGIYGQSWEEVSEILDTGLKTLTPGSGKRAEIETAASEYLLRMQTMLSSLLPAPPALSFDAPLLQFGNPPINQNYHNALELAKPSPRFGMLLVGNVEP
ncbi:unnamed protein product [Cyclocybe aegerita]|uniref:Conserved oligomeric Golgi complex subunit 1 n=1 Tax=Cyclocybe aegerita TaxID=1973307 RepID=A0A8S0VS53_CYCAE|nr:unnamed protein product [Cyclocybe aegerita]